MTRKAIRDIELSFIYPPIPDRNCDWQATRKGWEPGEPAGHGRTPVVALAALLEQEMEVEDQCAVKGHCWVGIGDDGKVVCDDCGIEKPSAP